MTLPDICPKDGVSQCKKKACHLYVVEWRTGDEQCVIGYRSTHKELSRSTPMVDTYAESTRMRIQKKAPVERKSWPEPEQSTERRQHLKRQPISAEAPTEIAGLPPKEPMYPVNREEVVVNDKDTTVFEARKDVQKEDKKRKSLDELMDLDLPDDYEEKFWD
ncbi:hypothetical protein RE474_06175 [Methanolobus sediminis]|uniref:Uncharacterized protein n=1 Tax=Methanolobus sediminis TaxID=3072978 RepID=A0AA51UPW2_9EURY|nr:hypothetical protein [Methanolobus sediminis]WMW26296.1 hypothetical protein RE474_06175 [Methanolobus sediminis]